MNRSHDLHAFMRELCREVTDDYAIIRHRALEDPGTAGDRVEETWASLLREWLPATLHVVTKGRVLGVAGNTSPQVDVVILEPDYPVRLRRRKVFLSAGVLAVFECKLTLRLTHL